MDTSLNKLVEFYLNNEINLRPLSPLITAFHNESYAQNSVRIVSRDHSSPYVDYMNSSESNCCARHACFYRPSALGAQLNYRRRHSDVTHDVIMTSCAARSTHAATHIIDRGRQFFRLGVRAFKR